ncbi:unnamed protein product (macronuclear) [Paramecium tetraurelia]|uniref:Uncharacterized protein n=1 Tax=Paramecium tetraurelia TaxID=5888 RepID=A0DLL7_PARTE|nr:uncharacterized protein GSPATT00018252001 [Paramecium tetraurelia]CAK83934.1 unnamed protein product [Paramecium tetraurelia]|eukprot:XP_001451331.1 hypothetical protein (macronuclear) [Paramecium tetraurelia strain d4-2]
MSQMESILRGGGCGTSKIHPLQSGISKMDNQELQNFFNKFNFYVEKICTKAVVAADQSESQEIMIALQWFNFQEENIYNLNQNAESVAKSYDLILEGIRKLLKSCLIYIRTDSFKCLYILSTTASLSKVIFSFHILKQERFMKCDLQQEFLDISDELRQQIKIEKNDLIQNQLEVYLFLTKTSFEISPNNSNERDEILKGCLSGIIRSIIDMKPSEQLLESLFRGACHIYKLHEVSNNRKQFEVYYQIDMLQWEIISYFKNDKFQNLDEILLEVQQVHENIVKNSNLWKYHYLWVQMIGKILQFNPLITKKKLSQLINSFNFGLKPDQIWNEYKRKGLLIQMNHRNDQAVIQLNQLQNSQLSQMDTQILEVFFKEWEMFLLLKDFLINEQYLNNSFTFGSYLKSTLVIEGNELQKSEIISAINNIKTFQDIMVSKNLLTLIKQNDENLDGVIKILSNFMKNKQYNERTTLKISLQQLKKIIQKLEDNFINTQDIIKIMSLNQGKLIKKSENKNFEEINKLSIKKELLELYILEDQNVNGEDDTMRNLIFEELKNFDFKPYKYSFLESPYKNKSKVVGEVQELIQIYQKEIYKLEINELQNDLLQYFQNLVNNLGQFYKNKCKEIQNTFSDFNLHLKETMIMMYQFEAVPKIAELNRIKQCFADKHFLEFVESLRFKILMLKIKLVASKKSFQLILEKGEPEKLKGLSKLINIDEFLLNVIEDFPQRIMRENVNLNLLPSELCNIETTEEIFEVNLSKQKGIIQYLIFKQSINKKLIEKLGEDLDLIEKEFGDICITDSPSQQSMLKIKKICQDLEPIS